MIMNTTDNFNTDNFNTGNRIRNLRTEKGLSQEQLALNADITTTYLDMIERNDKNPTIKVLERICGALDISLAVFFSDSGKVNDSMDETSYQIMAHVSMCNDSEKRILLHLIKYVMKFKELQR